MGKRLQTPKSILDAEAAIAAQEAMVAAARQAVPTTEQPGVQPEQPVAEPPPVNEQPSSATASEQHAVQPEADALAKSQARVAELEQKNKVLAADLATATEQSTYFKQRWDSLAGIHKKQVTDVQQQNQALVAHVAELEQALKDVPQADADTAAVRRMLGEKADNYGPDQIEAMAMTLRLAKEGAGKDVQDLQRQIAALRSSGAQAKSVGFWDKVEKARPGFMAARDNFESGYEMWFTDVNPNSADSLTRQQCMEMYAKLGNIDGAIAMLDEFAKVAGYRFGAPPAEQSLVVPPQAAKPAPGIAAPTSTTPITTTAPPKPRFPEAFAMDFATKWARLRVQPFHPFAYTESGKTVQISTKAQGEKLANDCQDALINHRTY